MEERLERFEHKLRHAEGARDYHLAMDLKKKFRQQEEKLHRQHLSRAEKDFRDVLDALRKREKEIFVELEQRIDARIYTIERELEDDLRVLMKQQKEQEEEIWTTSVEEFERKEYKTSPEMSDLRIRERHSCKAGLYSDAEKLQKEINRISKEQEMKKRRALHVEATAAVKNLKQKHEEIRHHRKERAHLEAERIRNQGEEAHQKIRVKFAASEKCASQAHARAIVALQALESMNFKVKIKKQAKIEEETAEKFAVTLATICDLSPDDVLPSTAIKKGSKSLSTKTKKTKKSKKREKNSVRDRICEQCHRQIKNVFTIPKDFNKLEDGRGIGCFCGPNCATAWNQVNSPPNLRWMRLLYIDAANSIKSV